MLPRKIQYVTILSDGICIQRFYLEVTKMQSKYNLDRIGNLNYLLFPVLLGKIVDRFQKLQRKASNELERLSG
jgi:hypothetical protein